MNEDTHIKQFLEADENSRIITTQGKVSYEEQESVIREVVTDALADPVIPGTQTVDIAPDGLLGVDLHNLTKTAYFSEGQFRILDVISQYRYLATTGVANCLAVFAHTPSGKSFGAHLNLVSMYYSLEEAKTHGGGVFQNMVDALKKAFVGIDTHCITISIVGGWQQADFGTKRKKAFNRTQEHMWSFSSACSMLFLALRLTLLT